MFQQILEASQNEKKGITLYVKGHQIGGVVTKVSADNVELRSREYSRIVVRIDAIERRGAGLSSAFVGRVRFPAAGGHLGLAVPLDLPRV